MNQTKDACEDGMHPRPLVFYASLPISLLLGVALAPMKFDPNRYLCAYGFGLFCAICYYAVGRKRKKTKLVRCGVGLLYLAPFLPILVAIVDEAIFLRQCLVNKPAERERERRLGQDDRGGGGPEIRAAEGNAGPASFLASLVER